MSRYQWKKQQAVKHNHLRDWRMAIDEHEERGFSACSRYQKVSKTSAKNVQNSIAIFSTGE